MTLRSLRRLISALVACLALLVGGGGGAAFLLLVEQADVGQSEERSERDGEVPTTSQLLVASARHRVPGRVDRVYERFSSRDVRRLRPIRSPVAGPPPDAWLRPRRC